VKQRLDQAMVARGLAETRSQASHYVQLGQVSVDGQIAKKPGYPVGQSNKIVVRLADRYVSRGGFKLSSVADFFGVNFRGKVVLDIGSSTGGFTDFALQSGAKKVIAVDIGTDQLHPKLRQDERVELHEKTDIRDFILEEKPDIIVCDVSFISLRNILPHVARYLMSEDTQLIAMVKPQFEAGKEQVNKGVIKNQSMRRQILTSFEDWAEDYFYLLNKRDSAVAGAKGNLERFYLLKIKH